MAPPPASAKPAASAPPPPLPDAQPGAKAAVGAKAEVEVKPPVAPAADPGAPKPGYKIWEPVLPDYFTLQLSPHLVWEDLNGTGIVSDHNGQGLRVAPGVALHPEPTGRHQINVRLFGEFNWFSKDLGQGLTSKYSTQTFGLQGEYLAKLHRNHFSIAPGLAFGLVHYSAEQGGGFNPTTFELDQKGAEFNKNPTLMGLDDYGLHTGLSFNACTLWDSLCLGIRLHRNWQIDPQPKDGFVDQPSGSYPAPGLSADGFTIPLTLDPVKFWEGISPSRRPAPAAPKPEDKTPEAKPEDKKPEAKPDDKKPDDKKPDAKPEDKKPEAKVEDTKTLSAGIASALLDAQAGSKEAKENAAKVPGYISAGDGQQAWFHTNEAVKGSNKAAAAAKVADENLKKLREAAKGTGDEAKAAKAELKAAETNAIATSKEAQKAYTEAKKAKDAFEKKKFETKLPLDKLEEPVKIGSAYKAPTEAEKKAAADAAKKKKDAEDKKKAEGGDDAAKKKADDDAAKKKKAEEDAKKKKAKDPKDCPGGICD